MKKALIFLAALLVFAVPGFADDDYDTESTAESAVSEAEAEDTKGMTPDNPVIYTFENDVNPDYYSGVWVDTGAGLKVWLPEYWEEKELSDEAKALGIVFKYGESGGMSLTLTSSKIPRAARPYELTDFHDELMLHYDVVEYADINGLPCLLFEDSEHSLSGFAYKTDNNFTLLGTIMPPEPDEWRDYAYFINNILHSVSASDPKEEESEAESESESAESAAESGESQAESAAESESSSDSGEDEESVKSDEE